MLSASHVAATALLHEQSKVQIDCEKIWDFRLAQTFLRLGK